MYKSMEEFERLANTVPATADEANELASRLELLGSEISSSISDAINIKELKKWVTDNYSTIKCGWTDERSEGNCSDCFSDGQECGTSWAAYEVGQILGMHLEEPNEQEWR